MATLQQAIDEIMIDLKAAHTGIRTAPDDPPDQVAAYPFLTAYAGPGTWEEGPAGDKRFLGQIIVELHVNRVQGLARAVAEAMTYAESVPNTIFKGRNNDRFNNTIDTFDRITYTFGPQSWDKVDTFGWTWKIEGVKIQSLIS